MPKGFYVKMLPDNYIGTLWVHSQGYSKKVHTSELAAIEWLVQRGCEVVPEASDLCKEKCRLIRESWLQATHAVGCEELVPQEEKDIDKCLVSQSGDCSGCDAMGYEIVVPTPSPPGLEGRPVSPSYALEETS